MNIFDNEGRTGLAYEFSPDQTPSDKSPIIGRDTFVYLGLAEGLLSLEEPDSSGEDLELVERWQLRSCTPANEQEVPLRSVTSVTVSPNGRDIVVGTADESPEGGVLFRLRETEDGEGDPECLFGLPVGSRSAALISVDQFFLDFISFTIGTTSGRLTSIDSSGARRWSFPETEPFAGSISSSPAVLDLGFVFASPDGRLHSVDQSGRARWTTVIGGPYSDDESVPSPTVFSQVFTVNADGDVVAFTPNGALLWTYSPDEDREIVGSLAVSPLNTEGGSFIGENVVFALDRQGTAYGIGSLSGELVRFCEYENRACLPSNCEDEAECSDEFMRCSETTEQECGGPSDLPCPDGESCTEQFRCVNDPQRACFRDFCITGDDDRSDGMCRREAKMPLTSDPAEFATAPVISIDGFIVAATTDGRVCARRLDGGIPNQRCSGSGDPCTPDSCAVEDRCCGPDDSGCTPGHCIADPARACSLDTCVRDDEGTCGVEGSDPNNWMTGCIGLDEVGSTAVSPPVIGVDGEILITTNRGLAVIQ